MKNNKSAGINQPHSPLTRTPGTPSSLPLAAMICAAVATFAAAQSSTPPSLAQPAAPGQPRRFESAQVSPTVPASIPPTTPQPSSRLASLLAWDADSKDFEAKPNELTAHFTFYVTNISSEI